MRTLLFNTPARLVIAGLLVVVLLMFVAAATLAYLPSNRPGDVNVDEAGVAIHGYDAVAYFIDGEATRGDPSHEYVWHGARWQFANATNRDLFAANPDHYAPRYGGYCSMGLAMGEFSDVDPENWTIVDGKLYLNKIERVQALWRKGQDAYIVAAEANWQKHREELRVNENLR